MFFARLRIAVPLSLVVGLTLTIPATTVGQDAAAEEETLAHAMSLSRAFRRAAQRVTPSVVTIISRVNPPPVAQGEGEEDEAMEGVPPEFQEFFKKHGGMNRYRRFGGPQRGMGSGVIIGEGGLILTNNHVVEGADEVLVRLSDGREFKGLDIKNDRISDLALISIKGAENLRPMKLGSSEKMDIGDWVIAIGSPFELEMTVSAGIISAKGRSIGASQRRGRYLQTDAAINPGNSGGPLVNLRGELIGINTAIASRSGGYQGIGFAIPVDLAKWVVSELRDDGKVQRAWLGVAIREMDADLGRQFGLARHGGVIIAQTVPDSPSEKAGILAGDVITHFAGSRVRMPAELQAVVERAEIGKGHEVHLVRSGNVQVMTVSLEVLPEKLGVRRPAAPPATKPPAQ